MPDSQGPQTWPFWFYLLSREGLAGKGLLKIKSIKHLKNKNLSLCSGANVEKSCKVQDWCAQMVSDTMIIPLVNHYDDGNENAAKQKV